MSAPLVLADANVLYSAVLRDLLMELAVRRAVQLRWTDRIQDEWIAALLKRRPDLRADHLAKTRDRMELALPDARVTDYEHLIDDLILPDLNDRHVLAAGIAAKVSLIVTFDLRDFVTQAGLSEQPVAVHPDSFLSLIAMAAPDVFVSAVQAIIQRTRRGATAEAEYVVRLEQERLPRTAQLTASLLAGGGREA